MKTNKINIKKILFILLFFSLIICILSPTKVSAMNQKEAGEYIANYAMNFYNSSNAGLVQYFKGFNYNLASHCAIRAHIVNTGTAWTGTGRYDLECVGFVSMVIKQSIGLVSPDGGVENGSSGFVAPQGYYPELFEPVSTLQKGDILKNDHHVMIYVGDGMIVHCDGGHGKDRAPRSIKRRFII